MFESLQSFPAVVASSFTLIGLAEFGDKSQLVCMTLAARYRPRPVFLGAVAAFLLLNLVAVVFGAAASHWLPQNIVTVAVAVLFIGFGIHAFGKASDGDEETDAMKPGHGLFLSTLLLITVAEFGDKTQIAVAGLGSTYNPYAVWLGATLALVATSALGVWAGRVVVQRVSVGWLHRLSGGLFVLMGVVALLSLFWE